MIQPQRFLPVLFCLLHGAYPMSVQAEPEVHLQQVYYDVDATTTPALHSHILRDGPRDTETRPALGLTRWKVHWAFKLSQSLFSCALIEVKASAHILVTVPRINPQTRDRMSDQIPRQLEDFFAAVAQHEKVHQWSGTRAAYESDTRLHQLPAYPDCASLQTAIKDITDGVVDKYSRLDNDFDAQSQAQGELPLLAP